jgi:hypothetical protein
MILRQQGRKPTKGKLAGGVQQAEGAVTQPCCSPASAAPRIQTRRG